MASAVAVGVVVAVHRAPTPDDGDRFTWQTFEVISHVSIQCADFPASARFYDAVLAPLEGERVMDLDDAIGYGVPPIATFWIAPRQTGEGFRETHIAFAAPNRNAVRAFFDVAVASGAPVLYEPRIWPEYDANYYGAFVRDPDGNNIEAVCHAPA